MTKVNMYFFKGPYNEVCSTNATVVFYGWNAKVIHHEPGWRKRQS